MELWNKYQKGTEQHPTCSADKEFVWAFKNRNLNFPFSCQQLAQEWPQWSSLQVSAVYEISYYCGFSIPFYKWGVS